MRLMHKRMYQSYLMQRRTGIYEKKWNHEKNAHLL